MLARLLRWFVGDGPRESTEHDPEVWPCVAPSPGTVPVLLRSARCLTAEQRATYRPQDGRGYWWLRDHDRGCFVRAPLPAADVPVNLTLYLEPGNYVLGVGTLGANAIRIYLTVPRL